MKMVKMFVLIISLFIVEYSVFFVVSFLIIKIDRLPSIYFFVAICFVLVTSLQNPIIYGVMNPNFRNSFLRLFCALLETCCPALVWKSIKPKLASKMLKTMDTESEDKSESVLTHCRSDASSKHSVAIKVVNRLQEGTSGPGSGVLEKQDSQQVKKEVETTAKLGCKTSATNLS